MNLFKLQLLFFLNIIYVSDTRRRIQGGLQVRSLKSYVVYLIKAPQSNKDYDEWMCGGALVSTWFIITAQGCVQDVEYMYAIAGYNVYVNDSAIENDKCTKEKKKKIVYIAVRRGSGFNLETVKGWAAEDIALAKVESEYDQSPENFCSYIPSVVSFNYDPRFQEPGIDAIVLGWGHKTKWRLPIDPENYNQKYLRYSRVKITENQLCKDNYQELADVIDRYNMICSTGGGEIDERGRFNPVSQSEKRDGCAGGLRTGNCTRELAIHVEFSTSEYDDELNPRESGIEGEHDYEWTETGPNRSAGICQNDHGGPLVTWVGTKEVLIGLATLFKVTDDSKCTGPYLFTSTACHGVFLDCVLKQNLTDTGKLICDSKDFDIVERHIDWSVQPTNTTTTPVITERPPKNDDDENLSSERNASDTLNNKKTTIEMSKAFRDLIMVEAFWDQLNSSSNGNTTVFSKT